MARLVWIAVASRLEFCGTYRSETGIETASRMLQTLPTSTRGVGTKVETCPILTGKLRVPRCEASGSV